jgi:peptidoglycan/LPS O-acetylase OafA/YrhL
MTEKNRNFGLDLLRAIAILSVLLLHVNQCVPQLPISLQNLFDRGWAGVDLFFVLSGYLIGGQAFRTRDALENESRNSSVANEVRNFWIRRWTRTVPLYVLVLGVYLIIKPALFQAPFVGFSWKYFFFIQNSGELHDFVQSWSLCIEEQFYFVFPVLCFFFRPKKKWLWLIPFAVSVAYRSYWLWQGSAGSLEEYEHRFRFNTIAHMDGISIGVFLAATESTWIRFSNRTRVVLAVLSTAALTTTLLLLPHPAWGLGGVFLYPLLATGFSCWLICVRTMPAPTGASRILVEKVALWSYGAYLWNGLLIRVFAHHPVPGHWLLATAVFVGATLIVSAITYKLVEVPGIGLRKQLLNRN